MPYNSCNNSYSQPSYPSYSQPYIHNQNARVYNPGYQHPAPPYQYPALTYPGYGYSGYGAARYASPSYNVPNVFSIIKTSPLTTDDNVCALNSYDTLTLDSGTSDHLTITGDKTNKKVSFALKQVALNVAGDTTITGQQLAPFARRTSGTIKLDGDGTANNADGTAASVTCACKLANPATGELKSRVLLTAVGPGTGMIGHITITVLAGSFTIASSSGNDDREFSFLVLN